MKMNFSEERAEQIMKELHRIKHALAIIEGNQVGRTQTETEYREGGGGGGFKQRLVMWNDEVFAEEREAGGGHARWERARRRR